MGDPDVSVEGHTFIFSRAEPSGVLCRDRRKLKHNKTLSLNIKSETPVQILYININTSLCLWNIFNQIRTCYSTACGHTSALIYST